MTIGANHGLSALTDKEKQTLRLIVRGHDAKSIARSLGLSVHTINDRLRDARRKMAVSSSREAARMLFDAEGGVVVIQDPDSAGYAEIGEAAKPPPVDQERAPANGAGRASRLSWTTIGVALMTLAIAFFALTALPQLTSTAQPPAAAAEAPNPAVVEAARQWLALLDQARWDESYRATGASFRKLNTAQLWAAASEKVRVPLGAMISRTFVSQQNLPAPPSGYEVAPVSYPLRQQGRGGGDGDARS